MTEFEFIFAIYALILGLSVVALLSGFGRALELRFADEAEGGDGFTIGWLTPLMAVFVMIDLLSFWIFAWSVRPLVSVSAGMLLGVVSFCSAYYLAARLVFPEDPDKFRDLDTHYWRVSRTVIGILLALVCVQWAYLLSLEQIREQVLSSTSIGLTLFFVGMMVTTILWRNHHVHAILLVAMSVRYLVLYLAI